jgi:thiamine kinase-like enzyme
MSLDGYELVLCHLDLASRNVVWLDDGSLGLLDWESAGFYPQFFEWCALRVNWWGRGDLADRLLDAFPKLTSDEMVQAEYLLRAWSFFQKYGW